MTGAASARRHEICFSPEADGFILQPIRMAKRSKKRKATGSDAGRIVPRAKSQPAPSGDSSISFGVRRNWVWELLLVLALFLIYSPVWQAGYVWDDGAVVINNPVIAGPLGLKEIWTTSAADICPATLTTFWLEYAVWGSAPLPYHLVNVLLHGLCAVLLGRVLRRLQIPGAWLGAALWAFHPVQVESVAWISELKNTQSAVFFLLSILFYIRWLETRKGDVPHRGDWPYGLSLLCGALAMTSKSSTVILPVVLVLFAWWMEGRWHWRHLTPLAPFFLMSLAAGIVSIWTQGLQLANTSLDWERTWPERLVTAGEAIWFYLGKLVWPHPLVTIYPRWTIDAGDWVSYLPLLAAIGILIILWLKCESWSRPYFMAYAYFLVALLPVLGLVNNTYSRYSFVADHFQYLASMGPLALAGAGIIRLGSLVTTSRPWIASTVGAVLLVALGTLSWQRTWVYQNQETLWTDTLAKNPECWAGYNDLGDALLQKGQIEDAMVQYRKAVEIYPDFVDAHTNLGTALLQSGHAEEAIAEYQKVLALSPDSAKAHFNLGDAFVRAKQVDLAVAQYQRAADIDPDYAEAHYNLGWIFLNQGRSDEAVAQFQDVMRLNPNLADVQSNLARAEALARQNAAQKK